MSSARANHGEPGLKFLLWSVGLNRASGGLQPGSCFVSGHVLGGDHDGTVGINIGIKQGKKKG